MATTERFILASPQAVWDVLADPENYGYWVVGSKVIRAADIAWPAPGSKFHHTVGFGPFKVSDHTEALSARRPECLRIRAKARPFGTAQVTLTMTPRDGGTIVSMTENPDGIVASLALNPIVQLLTAGRNKESLMRLEELALLRAKRRDHGSGKPERRAQAPSPR